MFSNIWGDLLGVSNKNKILEYIMTSQYDKQFSLTSESTES